MTARSRISRKAVRPKGWMAESPVTGTPLVLPRPRPRARAALLRAARVGDAVPARRRAAPAALERVEPLDPREPAFTVPLDPPSAAGSALETWVMLVLAEKYPSRLDFASIWVGKSGQCHAREGVARRVSGRSDGRVRKAKS